MIKLILAALFLSAGGFTSSASVQPEPVPVRITIPGAITSLVINEGITVVLTNEQSKEIIVEGGQADQNPLKLELSSGKLTISRNAAVKAGKLVVYVPAGNLRTVSINGVAELTSNAVLPLKKLDISMESECSIRIRTTGKVNIITWNDIEYRTGEPLN